MNFAFLAKSIGQTVQLERGGPDKVVGTLVAVRPDHIVLKTPQHGVLYCSTQHIKSVTTPIVKDLTAEKKEASEESSQPEIPVLDAEDFRNVLQQLKTCMIRVNHSGPNSLQGVLMDLDDDGITVVHEMKDYVYFPIDHIRAVAQVYHLGKNDNERAKDDKKQQGQGEQGQQGKQEGKRDQQGKHEGKHDQQGKHEQQDKHGEHGQQRQAESGQRAETFVKQRNSDSRPVFMASTIYMDRAAKRQGKQRTDDTRTARAQGWRKSTLAGKRSADI